MNSLVSSFRLGFINLIPCYGVLISLRAFVIKELHISIEFLNIPNYKKREKYFHNISKIFPHFFQYLKVRIFFENNFS